MTDHLLALIAAHFACADLAANRPLSQQQVQQCSAIYQEIKLSFVPGMTAARYAALPITEKTRINKQGFLAFLAWREAHPHLVDHLEAVAKGQTPLAKSS